MSSSKRKDGLVVTNGTATPLTSGMHPYWDAHWKNVVLQYLSASHPNVKVEYKEGGDGFSAVFRKDDRSGRELCGSSRSLESPKTTIPEIEVDRLVDDLDKLHQEAEKDSNTEGARQFARDYRVPDPRQMRSAWRISRGPFKKLLVLWGYHPKGAANDVVLPLTPTSKGWDDAKRRVDLKEALRNAGRIGKSRFDWGWIFSCVLSGLLLLLLLLLIVYGLMQANGCRNGGNGPGPTPERPTNVPPIVVGHPSQKCKKCGEDAKACKCQKPGDTPKTEKNTPENPDGSAGSGGDGGSCEGTGGDHNSDGNGGASEGADGSAGSGGVGDSCEGADGGPDSGGNGGPREGAGRDSDSDGSGGGTGGGACPENGSNDKMPDVVVPRFSIRLESNGDNGDGTYDPTFSLISQKNLPSEAKVLWKLDEKEVTDETAQHTSFRPHFTNRSKHVIVAGIEITNKDTQWTPIFTWSPDAPDTGKSGADVRRFIEQIGERNDNVGTYYLFDVGSDPQDGKVSVLSWSVRKVEPKTSQRDIQPVHEGGNTNVLQIHSKAIAGNAKLEISAKILIKDKGEREIKAKRTFVLYSSDTTDSVTSEESRLLQDAGKGVVPSVYLVVTPKGSGTAFAVGKKYLVTNRHVVEGCKKVSLYAARSDKKLNGVVEKIDVKSDLALIKLRDKSDMTALALAEKVSPRQIASCVGYSVPALNAEKLPSGGYEPTIATGVLNGYNPWAETAYSDLKAFHGNSGSPVVNEEGKVVGVIFAGTWNQTKDGEIKEETHRSCIVTLQMLKRFLGENGIR